MLTIKIILTCKNKDKFEKNKDKFDKNKDNFEKITNYFTVTENIVLLHGIAITLRVNIHYFVACIMWFIVYKTPQMRYSGSPMSNDSSTLKVIHLK